MGMLLTIIVPVAGIAIMLLTAVSIAPLEVRSAIITRFFPVGGPQALSRSKVRRTA